MLVHQVIYGLGILSIICICGFGILFIVNLINKAIRRKRKREERLKDFMNHIMDEDLKREWLEFLETGSSKSTKKK